MNLRTRYRNLGAASLASLMGCGMALADEDGANSAVEAKIRAMAPQATTIAISETPIDGLLQVQVNNEIVYASADAKYLIAGRIIDMDTQVNLTDQAKASIRKELLQDLDHSRHITFAAAEPQHELLVFTDIDCGYCRKLHSQIAEYMAEGISIQYLAFPRAGIGSHSYEKYVSVWCADDPQGALTDAKAGNEPEPLQCDNPVSEQYDLGLKVGVTGTPALLTSDGTLIPGYVPPKQLSERLAAIAAQPVASQ
ncbi:MAG: thioredoxin fold domain-containing protein [Xanthomonadales bacterium]|nr:thioredoxin fold domain-containing protein [Xanthomonadales bacterium]NIN58464.1 thioredoxin fold domain-containing protein [Xanthomonadales bacterium]NIN73786.1 thioredoxin fold domain-containing protein [Xanthomonadales bacterium]NIO13763.1 thioredoxin fold domain-containing protein [Xanthomonadales bacterium]NIP10857.1 thioredoxin fold domain-containing protein [Xanthomonadales bacterium]